MLFHRSKSPQAKFDPLMITASNSSKCLFSWTLEQKSSNISKWRNQHCITSVLEFATLWSFSNMSTYFDSWKAYLISQCVKTKWIWGVIIVCEFTGLNLLRVLPNNKLKCNLRFIQDRINLLVLQFIILEFIAPAMFICTKEMTLRAESSCTSR